MLVDPLAYYIVDFNDPLKIRFYNKPFEKGSYAKDVIDAYIGEGIFLVLRGTEIILHKIKAFKRVPFRKYIPKQTRPTAKPPNVRAKRKRLKGQGIRTHQFKRVWDPLPEARNERIKYFNKDRSVIHTKILRGNPRHPTLL